MTLLPGQVLTLRLSIFANDQDVHQHIFSFTTNHKSNLSFSVKFQGVKGQVLFTPGTLRFDMYYPKISESKIISAKNKFKSSVQILNARGSKPFIKSTILNSLL